MDPFASVIGHQSAKEVLLRMISHDRLPHALLFVGQHSVGKTSVIKSLIKHLMHTGSRSIAACPDITLVEREISADSKRKTAISIKQIRTVIDRLSMTSFTGVWKIAFIKEADRLSTGAANALLKTLEEPKGQTLIILRAPSRESVLPTVASRCQTIHLTSVSSAQIADALQKRGFSKDEAEQIAKRSYGRPGIALRYMSDSAFRARKEAATHQIQHLLKAQLPEQFRSVTELIPKTDFDKAHSLSKLLDDWTEVIRDKMMEEIASLGYSTGLAMTRTKSNRDHSVKAHCTFRLLRAIEEVQEGLKHNINPHLALEHIFLSTHV